MPSRKRIHTTVSDKLPSHSARKSSQIRRAIAAEAARIMSTQSQFNFRVAKLKAAERLGFDLHTTMPGEVCGLPGADLHNDYAHYARADPQAIETMTTYGTVHANHMAALLDALAAIPEGEGTLLDNTLVVWVSELGNGEHAYETWPVVLAGGSAFTGWELGRYLRIAPSTPALSEGWQGAGVHESDWPNDLAGTPHQKLLVSVARAFDVRGEDGELVDQVGLASTTTADGTAIDLTGGLF